MLKEVNKENKKLSFEERLQLTVNRGAEAVKLAKDFKHKCNFKPMNKILSPEELKEFEKAVRVLGDIHNKIYESLEFGTYEAE